MKMTLIEAYLIRALRKTRDAIRESKENPDWRQTWLVRAKEHLATANYYLGLMEGNFRRMP